MTITKIEKTTTTISVETTTKMTITNKKHKKAYVNKNNKQQMTDSKGIDMDVDMASPLIKNN